MYQTKVFTSGGSQAVRLPKSLRFEAKDVLVERFGNGVIIQPKAKNWSSMRAVAGQFTDDFMKHPVKPERKPRSVNLDD